MSFRAIGRGERYRVRTTVLPLASGLLLIMAVQLEAADIAGVYVGTYTCGQQTIPLRLTISSQPDGALGGEFSFQPPTGAPRGLTETAFSLRGRYAPETGRFNLVPGRWVTRAAIGYQMVGLEGAFDPSAGALRGKIANPGCGAFDVKRDASRSAESKERIDARDEQMRSAPSSAAASGKPPESCLAIIRWSSRFEQEYSGENWRGMAGEMLGPKLINLFEDEYFTPYFGKPFDQMTQPERFQIGRGVMRQCVLSAQFHQQFQGGLIGMLDRPFTLPAGGFSGPAVASGVAERRRVRAEYKQTLGQLKALPATADSYPKALTLETRGKTAYAVLWPSEFKLFEADLGDAKRRSAEPLLVARVGDAIAGAQNREGILRLDQVAAENRELFQAVGPDIARREDARLTSALAQGLQKLMADERRRIDALGAGLPGLEAGVRWFRDFRASYQAVATDESVRAALARFTERRSRDLGSSAGQLDAAIRKARSSGEVQDLLTRYTVESDRSDPAGAPLFRAVTEQQWKLAQQQEKEKFSGGVPSVALAQGRTACELIPKTDLEALMGFRLLAPQTRPPRAFDTRIAFPGELASSGCFYEPALPQTKQFNDGIEISVRYLRGADANELKEKIIEVVNGSRDGVREPHGAGFPYPAVYSNAHDILVVFKEAPAATTVLEIKLFGASRDFNNASGALALQLQYEDKMDHAFRLASAILGKAPAPPGTPHGQLISQIDSLRGQAAMAVEVRLNGQLLSPNAQPQADLEQTLRQNGIKILRTSGTNTVSTLSLKMDTVGFSSFNGQGGLAFNLRLEFRQILPLPPQGSAARFIEAPTWWTGTFGVNGSDRFRREASEMTAEFVESLSAGEPRNPMIG